MFEFLPFLQEKPFFIRLSVLILIIAVSMVFTMVLGIIIAIPIFGFSIIELLSSMNDFTDVSTIHFLKYFQVVNQVGVFILPALFFGYLYSRKPSHYLKLDKSPSARIFIVSVILILVSIPAINWMVELNEQMKLPEMFEGIEEWMRESEHKTNELTEVFLNVTTLKGLIVNLVIIALLAAVGEEFLFRGVVLQLFHDWIKNVHVAILLSAIIFSAMHLQFYGFLPRMVLGILFGYIFVWSGSLWIPVLLHFIFNGITVVGAYLYQKGHIEIDVETLGSTDNVIVIVTSFLLVLVCMVVLFSMKKRTNSYS